jgi:Polysaccharide deacetylase
MNRRRAPGQRAVIHLDLDGASAIYRVHGWPYDADHDRLFDTGLRHALEFFDRAKVRATLFVIAEDLDHPRKRELIAQGVRQGHEIASHSLTHRKLTTLKYHDKRREVFESRGRIATKLGVEVRGFRAPEFDIDYESLDLIDDAGYTYDSSVFHQTRFARKIGAVKLSASPHYPLENGRLVELPLPMYAPLPVPFHPCYSLVLGTWYFRLGLRRFQQTGLPLVLLFHLTDFSDPLPNDQLPNWRARFYTLSHISREEKWRRCEQMLELVRHNHGIADTSSLLPAPENSRFNSLCEDHPS